MENEPDFEIFLSLFFLLLRPLCSGYKAHLFISFLRLYCNCILPFHFLPPKHFYNMSLLSPKSMASFFINYTYMHVCICTYMYQNTNNSVCKILFVCMFLGLMIMVLDN